MGIVGHEPGVVALRQRRQPMQGRDIAVHRKDAVGRDQGAPVTPAQLREQQFHVSHVRVAKRHDVGPREPRAGPQTGMGQFVDQDEVASADQRGDDAEIGEVAGAEDAGSLRLLESGEPRLQFAEQGMIAGHQAGGAGADTINAQRLDGRLLHGRMMGQIEVIVAAKRQQAAAVAQQPKPRHPGGVDERTA